MFTVPDNIKLDNFWNKVAPEPNTGCLLWTASLNHSGYGECRINEKTYLSHRVSYFLKNGPFENHLCVLHKCDTPGCVNPDHLFLGTRKENCEDKIKKGRMRFGVSRGESQGLSKLKAHQVIEIREKYKTNAYSHRSLAKEYEVSDHAIYNVLNRKTWTHI